ncbi:unnamed protein product [Phytophthora fragariaefolia]|uniref:Unnamed protein product n=1 Tax=Phytophthora fragariaefolia TaxID=1490495 RepID=A0A9W6YNR9_9STRA|nr:unnamed protein product [Phytophthora fragariaefolia]
MATMAHTRVEWPDGNECWSGPTKRMSASWKGGRWRWNTILSSMMAMMSTVMTVKSADSSILVAGSKGPMRPAAQSSPMSGGIVRIQLQSTNQFILTHNNHTTRINIEHNRRVEGGDSLMATYRKPSPECEKISQQSRGVGSRPNRCCADHSLFSADNGVLPLVVARLFSSDCACCRVEVEPLRGCPHEAVPAAVEETERIRVVVQAAHEAPNSAHEQQQTASERLEVVLGHAPPHGERHEQQHEATADGNNGVPLVPRVFLLEDQHHAQEEVLHVALQHRVRQVHEVDPPHDEAHNGADVVESMPLPFGEPQRAVDAVAHVVHDAGGHREHADEGLRAAEQ